MTQPFYCSPASPWGIHSAIRDNACQRCGWPAPRPVLVSSIVGGDPAERSAAATDDGDELSG